jgi:hypothetical protein
MEREATELAARQGGQVSWRGVPQDAPHIEGEVVKLRCLLDGLLLPACFLDGDSRLLAYDGEEGFELEALEALYYEVVTATSDELLRMEQARYRLLRRAEDFHWREAR